MEHALDAVGAARNAGLTHVLHLGDTKRAHHTAQAVQVAQVVEALVACQDQRITLLVVLEALSALEAMKLF